MALYTSFNPNNASTPTPMATEAPLLFHDPLVQRAARAPVEVRLTAVKVSHRRGSPREALAALERRLPGRLDAAQAARP